MSCTCKYGGGPAGICGFCKHRAATNERLTRLEDAKASADYARGVADERARVVADLRARSQRRSVSGFESAVLLAEAGRIERGEHEEAT